MAEDDSFGHDIGIVMQQMEMLNREIPKALPRAVADGAELLQREAEPLAPVRKGRLRTSGGNEAVEADGDSASHKVFFEQFYARFQELGTRKMSAQPFLRPAAEMNRKRIFAVIQTAVNGVVNGKVIKMRSRMKNR